MTQPIKKMSICRYYVVRVMSITQNHKIKFVCYIIFDVGIINKTCKKCFKFFFVLRFFFELRDHNNRIISCQAELFVR